MANGKRKINLNKKIFPILKGLIVYVMIALAALIFFYQVSGGPATQGNEVPISQIVTDTKEGKINRITLEGDKITAEVKNSDQKLTSHKEAGESIYKILESSGVDPKTVTIEVKDLSIQQAWLGILSAVLPIIILVGLMFLLFRNAREAGQGIFSFGQSRARLYTKDQPQIKFTDVAGAEEAKRELAEVVDFLKNPKKYQDIGARTPKGVLLVGPPGTGKTLLSRSVAGEANVPFYSIAGSEFMEMLVGVGASVSGDTPILIKDDQTTKLVPIQDFIDQFYQPNEAGAVKRIRGFQTLGFDRDTNGFWGTKKGQLVFKHSVFKNIAAVYRHRADEIYEIEYLGGKLRTTGDHSVFVRDQGRIIPKEVRNLQKGDLLVELPSPENEFWTLIIGKTSNPFLPKAKYPNQFKRAIVKKVTKEKYDGFVYDLCGVENEAFFGGEKPVLLHNSRVRDMFAQAKKAAPAIIFIDEIESIGRQRGMSFSGGHDEREQTLNQILVEMDGFTPNEKVIVIGASNRPDLLDAALIRPGRFDRRVVLGMPDLEERKAIIELHMKGKPFTKDVSTEKLARRTVGFSGADLANMLNEAAILAAREGKTAIDNKDLEEAATKEKLGPQRKRMQSEHDRKLAAYHEAGHAIVGHFLKNVDPVHRISIVSRGMSGGHTLFPPTEDRSNESKSRLVEQITAALGGQAAEELVFKDISTGAASDIDVAMSIARSMVTQYGMSSLGPLSVNPKPMFGIWKGMDEGESLSPKLHDAVDAEIKKIMDSCYKNAE
ncbi:ATP-dependent metallopeptidase FtsH/Yme1/Tma family protein, partial [Candidatus Gottesmanbacteria bacterium]|nr:ATP-dependent metallopeptidase FtsH/Yme1/Tma family protein [Candidatus Gottesmanbacteria bacterium]